MVIISLIGIGVVLARDHYAEKKLEREAHRLEEEANELVSAENSRRQQEDDAFNELQKYASFQDNLSSRVMGELSRDELKTAYPSPPPSINSYSRPDLLRKSSNSTIAAHPRNQLSCPIFIPQNTSEYGRLCWARTYSPNLMHCGIEQQNFLRFIDSFNKSLEYSSWLEAVNIAAIPGDGGFPLYLSDLSAALGAAATIVSDKPRRESFIEMANTTMFCHRGLVAMVLTYQPDNMAQTISLSTNSESPYGANEPRSDSIRSSRSSGVPSISKLRQMSTFVAEQTDIRPPIKREHSSSSAYSTPDPRFSTEHTNKNALPLTGLFSAVTKNRAQKKEQRKRLKAASTLRPTSNLKKVDFGSGPIKWRSVEQWAEDTEAHREEANFQLEPGATYLVVMNDPSPQPPRFSWLMAVDRANKEQRGRNMSMSSFHEQTDTVMTDKMDIVPATTIDPVVPPPAYWTGPP